MGFHSFAQPCGQKVVHALEQSRQIELFLKIIEQIARPERPLFRAQKRELKTVLAAHTRCRAFDIHLEAAIGAEQDFRAGIAGDLLHAVEQSAFYLIAVFGRKGFAVSPQFHQDFFFPLFRDGAGVGISAADVFRIQGFLPGKPGVRGAKPLQAVAHSMLAALMLRVQGFQLAKVGGKLYLHEDKRIAGGCGLHFGGVGGFRGYIINDALKQIALAELFYCC